MGCFMDTFPVTLMMEWNLLVFLCFPGFVPCVLSETRKYFLVQQGMSWTDARIYCRASHTDLAIVKSNDDLTRLQNEAQNQNFASSAWVGLYSDINGWHWSLNNEPVGSWRTWDVGEPNNNGGKQNCGGATPWGWWDLACTELWPFICFDETKTGTARYVYISTALPWSGAQTYCRQHHTDLASARDANENSALLGKILGVTWFGLTKDPWKWVDNSDFSIFTWWSGEPNNYWWNENCGIYILAQAGDDQCTIVRPFFCYSESRKRQVVKMRIRSDLDLNDSTENATILEKIRQKLRARGLEKDIVLKLRVKLNGEIFERGK